MKLAGDAAKRFCRKPDPNVWSCLVFGEDDGVCSDGVKAIKAAWSRGQSVETTTLGEDDVRRDPAHFFDALAARSLLGDAQLIRVRTSGDKIASLLLEALALGEQAAAPPETRLIIEAGPLKPRGKLRAGFEAAKNGAALHMFADEAGDVAKLVTDRLGKDGLDIAPEALDLFIADLPGHRGLANSEIEKLCLYGRGLGRTLQTDDVRAISATEGDHALTALIDAVFQGETHLAWRQLDQLYLAGTSPISVLRALQRQAQRLLSAHGLMGQGGEIGMKLRPPVFKSAWPAFRGQMALWPSPRLLRLLERIYETELAAKTAGGLASAGVRRLVGDLTLAANRAKARR